jgi:predicted transcriptional regulator
MCLYPRFKAFLHMVRRIEWLSPADIYILQFFVDHEIVLTPKVVAINTEYDQSYVGKRCRTLVEHGLLERPSRGQYQITEIGREFIESGLDPDVLETNHNENG